MTLEEFYKWLQTQPIEDKIVYIKYKYSWEEKWTYDNQILEVESENDTHYEWLTDWNEGQDDVWVLGCMSISKIDIPIFEESEE